MGGGVQKISACPLGLNSETPPSVGMSAPGGLFLECPDHQGAGAYLRMPQHWQNLYIKHISCGTQQILDLEKRKVECPLSPMGAGISLFKIPAL
jgi:hypothetical protein